MKIQYINKRFNRSSLEVIDTANGIIETYKEEGYDLTLRQLYYQFVAGDLFPDDRKWRLEGSRWVRDPDGTKNAEPNYKWLGDKINDGRLAGLVDWDSIVDRTRSFEKLSHWDSPQDFIESVAGQYGIDTREDQADYIEVWVEKDALVSVVEHACVPEDVGFLSCRGYLSQSTMWAAGQRFRNKDRWQNTYIIHLGDLDPSGVNMTEDIQKRMRMFGSKVIVKRIALTTEQVEQFNPPPSPAKEGDSRFASYVEEFGDECWELDALDPRTLNELITDAILIHTQPEKQRVLIREQREGRKTILSLAENIE